MVRLKKNPNDCVMCGAIFHQLDTQQYQTRQKVECGAAELPRSGVSPDEPHKFGFHFMPWF